MKYFKYTLIGILSPIAFYFLLALFGALIPVNRDFKSSENGFTIYVTTNGFHTDLVLPVLNRSDKCFRILQNPDLASYSNSQYISFGWGSKSFYLDGLVHDFPSIGLILYSICIPNETLMHVGLYKNSLKEGKNVVAIKVSPEQYEKLVDYVNDSFVLNEGYFEKILGNGYFENDFFFAANNNYHLFKTCNVWTGSSLKQAGIKVSLWTPLESGVFYYLRK